MKAYEPQHYSDENESLITREASNSTSSTIETSKRARLLGILANSADVQFNEDFSITDDELLSS